MIPVVVGGALDLANERGVALWGTLFDRAAATIVDLDCDKLLSA